MVNEPLVLAETYDSSSVPTEYIVTEHRLLTKSKARKFDGFVSTVKDVFLPSGYPDSVSIYYLSYQLWDTAQAFCSSVTGALAGRAVLTGYGVGDQSASVAAATLAWLLRDGCGMVGRILFAWARGTALDWDCKRYRLLADVLNDLAILLQLLCPLVGAPGSFSVTTILCAASVLLSLVGVCGGATRAALTMHQARRHNMADVSAKDASMETLNPSRLHLVVTSFVASGCRSCSGIVEVNQSEPLLRPRAAPLRLGCSVTDPAAVLPAANLIDGLRRQRHRRVAVFAGPSAYYAVLAAGATSSDQLLAAFECELLYLARIRPHLFDSVGGCSDLLSDHRPLGSKTTEAAAAARAERLMPDFLAALGKAGWTTEPLMLGPGQYRLTWSKSA